MKNILTDYYLKHRLIIKTLVIGILSFLTTILKSSFSLNPFVIFFILLSAKTGNYLLILVSIISSLSGAFIKSVNYGIEIGIICSITLLCLALPKFKNKKLSSYFLIFSIYLLISPLYLISSFSLNTLQLIITSFIVSLILITYLEYEKEYPLLKYILILLLPSIFIEAPIIFFAGIYLSLLICLTNEKLETRLSLCVISLVITYTYFYLSLEQIIMITGSFIVSSLVNKKFRSYVFTALICSILISKYPTTFYKIIDFYPPIISLLVCLLFKNEDKIEEVKPDEDNLLLSRIKNIEEYVSLIEETSPLPNLDKSNMVENLKIKPCNTCLRKYSCIIPKDLEENLPSSLTMDYKKDVLKSCPNGSKIIYRYKVVQDMVKQELKDNMVVKERHSALKGIITPLKTLCEPELITIDKNSLNNLLKEEVISNYKDDELSSFSILTKEQIGLIEKYLNKRISINHGFDYIHHIYNYHFLSDLSNHFNIDYETKGFTKTNGDSISFYKKDGEFEFFLIDAMGHFESSYKYSYLARRLLELSRTHKKTIDEKLTELNNILLYQNNNENYITLDYLYFNKVTNELYLYKFGSSSTYLFHDNEVIEFENKNLPLGILPYHKKDPIIIKLNKEDKLLFMTDGFDKITKEDISLLFNNKYTCKEYLEDYSSKYGFTDDATISLISII